MKEPATSTAPSQKRDEAEKRRRADGIRRLANRLGCTSPMYICDALLMAVVGHPCLHPVLLEKWLAKRRLYDPESDESIRDCIVRCYGEEWAELAESLI